MLPWLQTTSEDLENDPDNLEELKFVLQTITKIKDISLNVETRIRDLQERYRVLDMYDLEV